LSTRESPSDIPRRISTQRSLTAEFCDAERAAANLARIEARVTPGVAAAMESLLAELPDPDSALNLFDRFTESAGGAVLQVLDQNRALLHYALLVFSQSRYLGDTLIRNPDLLPGVLKNRNLDRSFSQEEFQEGFARFRARSDETDISVLLGRFKRREYVRIMLRDALEIAPLAETTAEISALSCVLIEEALREAENAMRQQHGLPQHLDAKGRAVDTPFAVLSLGKLGGNELNYSSDIDLLYLYGDGEALPDARISLHEYFIRLAQSVTEILSRMTTEGSVFRIDLRLRPQGREGEPAVALSHALRYYSTAAQDWEKQALIKLGFAAGDSILAREFIHKVQSHVYREELNLSAIETALRTRDRISNRRRSVHDMGGIDVKLDRGGIRDIEFLVQCLQRMYGGAEPWLRSGGTLFSLHKLHDKGHIGGKDFQQLTNTYEFFRKIEHCVQLREGQQIHRLPQSERELQILCRSVAGKYVAAHQPEDLLREVQSRMASVTEIYDRIIHQQRLQLQESETQLELHVQAEVSGPEQSYHQILHRLAGDSPELYSVASAPEIDPITRRNLYRFLSSALTSSERYAAVLREPQAVAHALKLFSVSDYLTDILIRHPEEIAALGGSSGELPAPSQALFLEERENASARHGSTNDSTFEFIARAEVGYAEKLALLRKHYRHCLFSSGVADILQLRPVEESLTATTGAAENAIRVAYQLVGEPQGFAVLALGGLGMGEFDFLSDADLLFVRDEATEHTVAVDAAEQMVHSLAAYTREGTVFPVDARLRPHGGQGELVVTPAQLENYFRQEAQPWEALTYTKLRWITGSRDLGERSRKAASLLWERFSADKNFLQAVLDMRQRLETADAGKLNFKSSPGGIYDVDFLLSYLLILHFKDIPPEPLRNRLQRVQSSGLLSTEQGQVLDAAVELIRVVEHVIRLATGKARKTLPTAEHGRETTQHLTEKVLRREIPELSVALRDAMQSVRELYLTILQ
jgi:glutamate-ammonia-ligase adenylyltransferase